MRIIHIRKLELRQVKENLKKCLKMLPIALQDIAVVNAGRMNKQVIKDERNDSFIICFNAKLMSFERNIEI